MSSEVGYIDCDGFDQGFGEFFGPPTGTGLGLHQVIFSQGDENWCFVKDAVLQTTQSALVQKTQKTARDYGLKISPMDANISGKAEVTIEWGGKDRPSVSGSISGGVSDNKGNKAEVKVEVENSGSKKATISAEYDKKFTSK